MSDIDPMAGTLKWDPNGPESMHEAISNYLTKLRDLTELGQSLNAQGGFGGPLDIELPDDSGDLGDVVQFILTELQGLRAALFLLVDRFEDALS